ncbi:DUF4112 domain-containing protein [Haloplanus litoreus]|uniref:DUF4112 domain-containing protein n=1 Tax=Haloplanus litoreus TaxID=767515 RepID=A0ABD5ZU20_9EURY
MSRSLPAPVDESDAAAGLDLDPAVAADFRRLRGLSHLLDDSIRVPRTPWRIGVEPLIGLLPVVGDAVGVALSLYVLHVAVRTGVPRATLARVVVVLWVDAAVGAVPLAGDLFDAYWKANRRVVRLLDARIEDPSSAAADRRYLWWAGVAVTGLGAVTLLSLAALVRWLLGAVGMIT